MEMDTETPLNYHYHLKHNSAGYGLDALTHHQHPLKGQQTNSIIIQIDMD